MVQFSHPTLLLPLWLLPILPLAWLYMHGRSERRLEAFITGRMQSVLRRTLSVGRLRTQAWLTVGGMVLLTVAAAGPQWGARKAAAATFGREVALALDVSRSMLAEDVAPSRLGRAKAEMLELARRLDAERVAVVAVRNGGALLCPLTWDRGFVGLAIAEAGPASAPRGETDLGEGLRVALDALTEDTLGCGAIVLFSDGEDLSGRAPAVIRDVAERGIRVIAVGFGSHEGARIPAAGGEAGFVRFEGREVVTRRNDEFLRTLADATGGAYLAVEGDAGRRPPVAEVCLAYLRDIAEREARNFETAGGIQRYQWFLLPAFLCLSAAAWLGGGARASGGSATASFRFGAPLRASRAGATLFAMAVWLGVGSPAWAASPPKKPDADALRYRSAVDAFAEGDYRKAADLFSVLPGVDPRARVRNEVGLGCALFRLAGSINDRDPRRMEAKVDYLRRAADAFLSAVRSAPGHAVARTNLTVTVLAFREVSAKLNRQEVRGEPGARETSEAAKEKAAEESPGASTAGTEAQAAASRTQAAAPAAPAADEAEIERILLAALRREEEYKADRRRRLERMELPLTARDW